MRNQAHVGMSAEKWNTNHAPGVRVRFKDAVNDLESVTTSPAWTLGDGRTVVVKIAGKAGGVGIEFLTVLP